MENPGPTVLIEVLTQPYKYEKCIHLNIYISIRRIV